MLFDDGDLTFSDTLNDSQWTDITEDSNGDDARVQIIDERFFQHSDYEVDSISSSDDDDDEGDRTDRSLSYDEDDDDDDDDDTYSLAESVEINEDITESDDYGLRTVMLAILASNDNRIVESRLPQFNSYTLLNNGKSIVLDLLDRISIKVSTQADSGVFIARLSTKASEAECEKASYTITRANKNHLLVNETHSPLLYATYINSFELVHDLVMYMKCDTNMTHSCHLNNEHWSHTDMAKNLGYNEHANSHEIERERKIIHFCDENAFEVHYYTPLMLAIKHSNLKMCWFLLENDADVNFLCTLSKKTCGQPSTSAISMAIDRNQVDILRLLVKHNGNLNERLWINRTSCSHMYTYIQSVIKHAASPNTVLELYADMYDYLINNDMELTHGDFYLVFHEIVSKLTVVSNQDQVFLLIKLLCILNLKNIQAASVWITKTLLRLITTFKNNIEFLKKILRLANHGGLLGYENNVKSTLKTRSAILLNIEFSLPNDKRSFHDFMKTPLSLKQICRLNLKSSLKYYTRKNIEKLILPICLKDYLYFFDI